MRMCFVGFFEGFILEMWYLCIFYSICFSLFLSNAEILSINYCYSSAMLSYCCFSSFVPDKRSSSYASLILTWSFHQNWNLWGLRELKLWLLNVSKMCRSWQYQDDSICFILLCQLWRSRHSSFFACFKIHCGMEQRNLWEGVTTDFELVEVVIMKNFSVYQLD